MFLPSLLARLTATASRPLGTSPFRGSIPLLCNEALCGEYAPGAAVLSTLFFVPRTEATIETLQSRQPTFSSPLPSLGEDFELDEPLEFGLARFLRALMRFQRLFLVPLGPLLAAAPSSPRHGTKTRSFPHRRPSTRLTPLCGSFAYTPVHSPPWEDRHFAVPTGMG